MSQELPGAVPDSLLPSPLRREARSRSPERGIERLFPFVRTFRNYRADQLRPDLVAGLTVALFAIPQAMAYALIAGFTPTAGIMTAAVAAILGAAFGSSEFLINGPTNALSVMLAANVALFAGSGDPVKAVVMLTLFVGVVQIAAGLLRIGTLTRFVSEPVLTGFTAGAGVYIVINQLPSLLGIDKSAIHRDFFGFTLGKGAFFDFVALMQSLHGIKPLTLGIGLLSFTVVRSMQALEARAGRRLPGAFLAVVLATLVVWACGFDHGDAAHRIEIVRDIQPLTRHLPSLYLPVFSYAEIKPFLGPALAIGLMGSIEAIAIGKLLAARAGHAFDASRQLIGEGFCNLGAAAVGGFASSGSFSRTAVNFEAGAVTRVSCMLSGVFVLVIVLAFAPAANFIPIVALAGTLIHIGIKLVDAARLRAVYATTTGDRIVLLTTFGGVLFAEHLENALFLGIAVSIYYALRRAEGFKLRVLAEGDDGSLTELADLDAKAATRVTVLNLQGELFFAAADELQAELIDLLNGNARVIVLRMREAYNLDATTATTLALVADEARRRGGRLILCGVRAGMYGTFERAGLLERMGQDAIFRAERGVLDSTRKAVRFAHSIAENEK
jgi:SulP family sulfate permease